MAGRAGAKRWKLEDAKARFSEVVRNARENGPQHVTVRGHDAVVVISAEEFERLAPSQPEMPFVAFMESLDLAGIEPEREGDRGRDLGAVKGWLLDTNVVAALINPHGAPSVKLWAAGQDEATLHISILTLAEYDKGIHNLPTNHADRPRYAAAREALAARFGDRTLALADSTVLRWGRMSGEIKRASGQAPPVIDTMIASTAVEHDLYLATRNVKDVRLSGAIVFDPWTDDIARFPLTLGGGRGR